MFWSAIIIITLAARGWTDSREDTMVQVAQWTRFEAQFTSSAEAAVMENPIQDIQVEVDFTSPTGRKQTVFGFWDGGASFTTRISFFSEA